MVATNVAVVGGYHETQGNIKAENKIKQIFSTHSGMKQP